MLRSRARSCAPLLRVALDGSIHHETMNDRRGRPSYRRAQEFNVLHFICETASYSHHISDYAAGLIGRDLNQFLARMN